MASPAALLTLQLYRPLSDTWERKHTVTVYMWLGYLGLSQNIQVPEPSRAGTPQICWSCWEPRGDPTLWPFLRASRSRKAS